MATWPAAGGPRGRHPVTAAPRVSFTGMKNFRHRVCRLQTSSPRARKEMFSAFGCCSVCEAAVAKRRRKGVSKLVTAPTEPACSLQGRRLHGTSPLVSQPRGGSPSCSFLPPPQARASAGRAGDSQSPPCFAEPGLGGGKRGQAHQRGGQPCSQEEARPARGRRQHVASAPAKHSKQGRRPGERGQKPRPDASEETRAC